MILMRFILDYYLHLLAVIAITEVIGYYFTRTELLGYLAFITVIITVITSCRKYIYIPFVNLKEENRRLQNTVVNVESIKGSAKVQPRPNQRNKWFNMAEFGGSVFLNELWLLELHVEIRIENLTDQAVRLTFRPETISEGLPKIEIDKSEEIVFDERAGSTIRIEDGEVKKGKLTIPLRMKFYSEGLATLEKMSCFAIRLYYTQANMPHGDFFCDIMVDRGNLIMIRDVERELLARAGIRIPQPYPSPENTWTEWLKLFWKGSE